MDLFVRLPPEIRLQVFICLRSKRYILQLIQASPVMFEQYYTSKLYITWSLLRSDLDDDMVQDAMGIILCPTWSLSVYPSLLRHFETWQTHQLPNPLETFDSRLIAKLDKLYNSLVLFIEDYLTKATAIFPPRELLCLPELSLHGHLVFQDQNITTRFDAADLKGSERRRLLKAFLRFELSCKTRSPQRKLDIYTIPINKYKGQEFQPIEREAIYCVHAYVLSLYGAMYAQCNDSWLPEIPTGTLSSHNTGLLHPDCLYVNPGAYASDLGVSRSPTLLTFLGFDLVTALIRCATSEKYGRNHLKEWFKDGDYIPGFFHFTHFCDLVRNDRIKDKHYQEYPSMYKVLYPRVSGSFTLHLNIYRQRAWVFLDDYRFYPLTKLGPHFPTSGDIDKEYDSASMDQKWFSKSKTTRTLHRSQRWHDERRGRLHHHQAVEEKSPARLGVGHRESLPPTSEQISYGSLTPFWR